MDGTRRILGLTMGEPAGIAPDITIAAWNRLAGSGQAFVLIGDPDLIVERAKRIGADCPVEVIETAAHAPKVFARALPVLTQSLSVKADCGRPDPANAETVLTSIKRAVDLTVSGELSGIVTNPIHKSALYGAGFSFQGHTDYLADLARGHGFAADPVMMLASGNLRTVPLTIHIALKDVPAALTHDVIVNQTRIVARDLVNLFGIREPRIGMTGLNPHAGEDATMGLEERDVIIPAITALAGEGIPVDGPLPADTVFHDEARAAYDVIICMYHDQALIPVKTIGFHDGVNTTLGLPFVRTSPDHGTALSLAGAGTANPSSLIAAIKLAGEMARHREAAG
ncbi:MAG: 4-hydroxythreonine-4-phosphate dehydrogenase PdxA [Rhizobiales bacterium]|nr:4-hydroxythreonine-4-phosphate dehydrogenase PdxA [Hyphomicrobiales bacterium]